MVEGATIFFSSQSMAPDENGSGRNAPIEACEVVENLEVMLSLGNNEAEVTRWAWVVRGKVIVFSGKEAVVRAVVGCWPLRYFPTPLIKHKKSRAGLVSAPSLAVSWRSAVCFHFEAVKKLVNSGFCRSIIRPHEASAAATWDEGTSRRRVQIYKERCSVEAWAHAHKTTMRTIHRPSCRTTSLVA